MPYKIEKITMFCYGEKEAAYKRLVPSGMLPALSIDGRMITESDRILMELERDFGPLGEPMASLTPASARTLALPRLVRLAVQALSGRARGAGGTAGVRGGGGHCGA